MGNFGNRIKLAMDYTSLAKSDRIFPQVLCLEITNHCNLKCVMCPHPEMTRSKGEMNFDLFCKLIDEAEGKSEMAMLYGLGESLISKNFFKYAEYAVKSKLATRLSSNATVITPNIAEQLVGVGLDFLILSVDGVTPGTYENIRVGGTLEKTQANVKKILQEKIRQGSNTHITVQIISMDATKKEEMRQRELFTPEEMKAVNVFRVKPHFDSYANPVEGLKHSTPCYILWNQMSVTWDGKVCMCCFDFDAKNPVGDLNKQTIEQAWNGSEIVDARQRHQKGIHDQLPEHCKSCTMPGLGYFSKTSVTAGAFLSSTVQTKLLPYFEKYWVLRR